MHILSYSPFSSLSSAGHGAGRCVGRAGRVWRTGRHRPPTSSQPCPNGEGGTLRRGGASRYAGGRQRNLPFYRMGLSHGAALHVTINHMSCELEELLHHLLLKIKAISTHSACFHVATLRLARALRAAQILVTLFTFLECTSSCCSLCQPDLILLPLFMVHSNHMSQAMLE